jgi:hypothetical protein
MRKEEIIQIILKSSATHLYNKKTMKNVKVFLEAIIFKTL